uniref:histidine kinase n=1 Tax=Moniliophthora roreri TaxID=221103 RepID=A0A0W0G6Q9_MONRR
MHPWLVGSLSGGSSTTKCDVQVNTSSPKMDSQSQKRQNDLEKLPPPVTSHSTSSRRSKRPLRSRTMSLWYGFIRRLRADDLSPSSSNTAPEEPLAEEVEDDWKETTEAGRTEKVVVDQSWASGRSGSKMFESSASSDQDPVVDIKSGGTPPGILLPVHDKDSSVVRHGFWSLATPLVQIRYRLWPAVVEFFFPRPFEGSAENQFRSEDWQSKKKLALIASLWFVINWGLGLWFVPRPLTVLDQVLYYGMGPALTAPIFFMVMFDFPRKGAFLYQSFLGVMVWIWAFQIIIIMYGCGLYSDSHTFLACPKERDFIGIFYYTTAPPTIGMFALKMNRLTAFLGAASFFVVSCSLMIPDRDTWVRSMINFAVYHAVLLYVHNIIEKNERRMFSLRMQVKTQFKATQRAQMSERKTAESKYRLTSYVFHEVRVPLNTALLAVQNMAASETLSHEIDDEFDALKGSLQMMAQVLNDVLDFNKMDSGQFELVNKPYVFHQAMRSLFLTIRMNTDAKKLKLITDLDPKIDLVARRAAYEAMDEKEEAIARHLHEHPDVDGVVIGDEARFRQIVNNLASNACKFTSEGVGPDGKPVPDGPKDAMTALSASRLAQHNIIHGARDKTDPPPTVLVRIEVSDTGCGIEASELARGKLFSAFNQTEQGRQQGGKGTGLGLALVRNIVKLSGGRLGVNTEVGKGSLFWVELPLGVGRQALIPSGVTGHDYESEGSMTSDLAKVRSAARSKVSPPAMTHGSLPMIVDAAALSASEISGMSKPQEETHSTLMNQNGSIELSITRQESRSSSFVPRSTTGSSSSTKASPLSTPEIEKSSASPKLDSSLVIERQESISNNTAEPRIPNSNPRQWDPDIKSSVTATDSSPSRPSERPKHIALPHNVMRSESEALTVSSGSGVSTSSTSPMTLIDKAYSRTSSSVVSSAEEIIPGLPVLVVDDDKLTRKQMEKLLTRMGCHVSVAENGEIALKTILGTTFSPSLLKTISFDQVGSEGYFGASDELESSRSSGNRESLDTTRFAVVFLDNQMPSVSGIQAVQILRQKGRRDFIVGLTGNALIPDQEEYLRAGVDHVLTKPVWEAQLREVLRRASQRYKRKVHTP